MSKRRDVVLSRLATEHDGGRRGRKKRGEGSKDTKSLAGEKNEKETEVETKKAES